MKKTLGKLLTIVMTVHLLGCGNAQQPSGDNDKTDTTNKHPLSTKSASISRKITPCLWVEKDAKAVVDYYLSIFKDGKLKESIPEFIFPFEDHVDEPMKKRKSTIQDSSARKHEK